MRAPISKKAESKKVSDNDDLTGLCRGVRDDEAGYEDMKSLAIGNMFSKHEGTANIIKEFIDTIRENVKVSAELDKMLGED